MVLKKGGPDFYLPSQDFKYHREQGGEEIEIFEMKHSLPEATMNSSVFHFCLLSSYKAMRKSN